MGRELPSDEDLQSIFQVIDTAEDAPVLVHCASSNRVGTVWSLYRADRGGLSADEAIAEGRAAGMTSDAFAEGVMEKLSK